MAIDFDELPEPDDEEEGIFLGVPNDYIIGDAFDPDSGDSNTGDMDRGYNPSKNIQLPRYKKGQEKSWGIGKSPAEIATMQQMLIDAGLIEQGKKFRAKVWDETTVKGYKKLLEYANINGTDEQSALAELISADQVDLTQTKPLQFELPSREDVVNTFGKASRSLLGRKLDQPQLDAMAKAYEEKLMEIQQQNYMQSAIEGAVMTDAPSLETFAENQIRSDSPGETQAQDYSKAYQEFSNILQASEQNVRRLD